MTRAVRFAALAGLAAAVAQAETPLVSLRASADVTVVLGGQTVDDGTMIDDDLAGSIGLLDVGDVTSSADLAAYHRRANAEQLFVLDIATPLAGPRDVVLWDGSSQLLEFDGAAHGIPDGSAIDALAERDGLLFFSFDVTTRLEEIPFDDADLARWNGTAFELAFDARAAGVPDGLDLDAVAALPSGTWLFSFDGSGRLGGVDFDDEDVLEWSPLLASWDLAYDGSAQHAAWSAADLDALDATAAPFSFVGFDPVDVTVFETSGQAVVQVIRTGDPAVAASVQYETLAGSAVEPDDFGQVSGALDWPAGDGSPRTILVPIQDDLLIDPSEQFTVRLMDADGAVLINPEALVTILDDESGEVPIIEVPTLDSIGLIALAAGLGLLGARRSGRATS